jgi:hypothetical protein
MPNWVYNGLTIEGNPDEVNKLVTQMNRPFVNYFESLGDLAFGLKQVKYPNPIFAFRNIYSFEDAGITKEEYIAQPPRNEGQSFADFMKHETNDWYNFNNREWGTKWDVAVSEEDKYPETYMEGPVENGDNLVVYYNFNTAWSRPLPALEKLSAQYPTLLFTLSYEEETGWGGEMEFLRGEIISESEYDNKCRDCDAFDTLEYCEDCENEVCSACGFGNEEAEENKCQTHMVESESQQKENA